MVFLVLIEVFSGWFSEDSDVTDTSIVAGWQTYIVALITYITDPNISGL